MTVSMAKNLPESSSDLVALAQLDSISSEVYDVKPYPDSFGFSAKIRYPGGLLYEPGPEVFALLSCVVEVEDEKGGLVPIEITLGCYKPSTFGEGYCTYVQNEDLSAPCSIVERSLHLRPLDANFFDENGRKQQLSEVLKQAFKMHIAPCKPFQGILFRGQKRLHQLKQGIYVWLVKACEIIIWCSSGKKVVSKSSSNAIEEEKQALEGYKRGFHLSPFSSSDEHVLISANYSIEYQGMTIAIHSVISLYILVMLSWLLFAGNSNFSTYIEANLTIIAFFAVPIVILIAFVLPDSLFKLMKYLARRYRKSFRKIGTIKKLIGMYYLGKASKND